MYNKGQVLKMLNENGDSVIDVKGEHSRLVTSDFRNKYIQSIRRTTRFSLKGNILVFSWTDNEFQAIPFKSIRNITPLSSILQNTRDN